jgi:hypothetical protein
MSVRFKANENTSSVQHGRGADLQHCLEPGSEEIQS